MLVAFLFEFSLVPVVLLRITLITARQHLWRDNSAEIRRYKFLMSDDRNIADFQSLGRCDQQRRVEGYQFTASRGRHVIEVNPPARVKFLDEGLQLRLLLRTPIILLE